MPRHVATRRKIMQGIADLPGVTVESSQRRHLSVGRHPPARDPFHDGVDAGAGVGGRGSGVGERHFESLARASLRPPTSTPRPPFLLTCTALWSHKKES